MGLSLKTAWTGLTLTAILLAFANGASAGPKEDVAAAASTWASALGEDEPDKVLPLYSDDAVLWGHCRQNYAPIDRHCGIISYRLSRFFPVSRSPSANS